MFKPPQIGTVHITVEEIRGVKDIKFVEVLYDDAEKKTQNLEKAKDISEQKWNETFTFPVHILQSEAEVIAVSKKLIGYKKKGHYKISIPSLQDVNEKHDWFPLTKLVKSKDIRKMSKEGPQKIGEVRLKIVYESLKPKIIQTIKGVLLESKWTKETSGGTVMNSPDWMNNPQFLLKLKKSTQVHVKLTQPPSIDEKVSFYIIKYEDFWKNKQKVVYNPDEIIKIDNFWAALFGEEAEANLKLEEGSYVIIPCNETPGYVGSFSINVWTSADEPETKEEDKEKEEKKEGEEKKEEKDEKKEGKKEEKEKDYEFVPIDASKWIVKSLKNEWTKTTMGGGNINGIKWRRNPQYLLVADEDVDCSVVLSQEEKDHSIGLYVVKYGGRGKKIIEYTNEVGKTDSFKFNPSVGIRNLSLKKGESYCIIPCTNEPKEGHFKLSVYSEKEFKLEEIQKSWSSVQSKKATWKGKSAGGSPNYETVVNNPQFLLTLPKGKTLELLIDLVVSDEYDAVGFIVVKRSNDENKERINKKEKIKQDDIVCQPEGYLTRMSVGAYMIALDSDIEDNYFVIIPSTFKPDVHKTFELSVYSDDASIKLEKLGDAGIEKDESSSEEESSDEESDSEDEDDK